MEYKKILTDVAFGKLKAPEGIKMILLDDKSMEMDVAEGKLKAPEEMDVILLYHKLM